MLQTILTNSEKQQSTKMKLAVWIVRKEGEALAEELGTAFEATLFRPWLSEFAAASLFQNNFNSFDGWIFLGTAGIATRYLQGLLKDKLSDPCVVVLDEGAGFAVSLCGGHEGGGNELAYRVATIVGATPVVTTASESLRPLVVGIGCRKGVLASVIEEAVKQALGSRSLKEVRELATISLKAKEPGLLEFSRIHVIPLRIFKQEDIEARQWATKPSEHVMSTVGVAGVCEPCALMASPRGRLLVPKLSFSGVAVAVVEDERRRIRI